MGFLKESGAGHYKNIIYQSNMVLHHVYSWIYMNIHDVYS